MLNGLKSEEILTCLIFIVIGYLIAMIFSRMCNCGNGFSVGGQIDCGQFTDQGGGYLNCINYFENNINPCVWRQRVPAQQEIPEIIIPLVPAMAEVPAACINAPNPNFN